jgi:hypothetical protein
VRAPGTGKASSRCEFLILPCGFHGGASGLRFPAGDPISPFPHSPCSPPNASRHSVVADAQNALDSVFNAAAHETEARSQSTVSVRWMRPARATVAVSCRAVDLGRRNVRWQRHSEPVHYWRRQSPFERGMSSTLLSSGRPPPAQPLESLRVGF